jgi:ketosteroid isomerase-like protein
MRLLVWLLSAAAWANEPSLIKADEDFCKAAAARGAEGFVSFLAPDAAVLPAKSAVVTGIVRLREMYRKTWARPGFSLTWKPLKAEMSKSGDLGYTFGEYQRRYTGADGKPVLETGKYMTVWRKQPDGSWKVIADMGN